MKILQINSVYNEGSTGKLVQYIHSGLKQRGIETVVCYGNGAVAHEKNIYRISNKFNQKIQAIISRVTGIMYGGCIFSTNKAINIIKKEKPDVVHLQCINGHIVNIYRLVKWLKKNDIKTVLTLHAEIMHTGGCDHAYDCTKWQNKVGCGKCPRWREKTTSWFFDRTASMWKKMYGAFEGFDENLIVVSVSPWLMERAKLSPILKNKEHFTILNGIDTGVFCLCAADELVKKHNPDKKKVVFHATPKFDDKEQSLKGGRYVIELARRMKDVLFVVAGTVDVCTKLPDNLILLGRIADQKLLAKYYSMADAILLTSKRETFSMVCAESLCCGTPVVGFKAGAPEKIAIDEYSYFVEYGDIEGLYKKLQTALGCNYDKKKISDVAIKKYSKENMVDRYVDLYKKCSNK